MSGRTRRFEIVAEEKNEPRNASSDRRLKLTLELDSYSTESHLGDVLARLRGEVESGFNFYPQNVTVKEVE